MRLRSFSDTRANRNAMMDCGGGSRPSDDYPIVAPRRAENKT